MRIQGIFLSMVLLFTLSACGGQGTEPASAVSSESTPAAELWEETPIKEDLEDTEEPGSGTLIVYFTWSGNTEEMALYIAQQVGGEVLKIEPETPYPENYNETGEVAKIERDENQRPAIANLPESMEGYDTIFIGYPIWWHTAPMIIGTFLESYDLAGVDVYPFTQSASMDTEQFENSMEFVRSSVGNATVHDGLFADESDTAAIDAYLAENGFSNS